MLLFAAVRRRRRCRLSRFLLRRRRWCCGACCCSWSLCLALFFLTVAFSLTFLLHHTCCDVAVFENVVITADDFGAV